jgi:hypothetical protein
MTNIVNFTPRPTRKDVEAMRLDGPARVVIFPGVRYERASTSTVERKARAVSKVVREPSTPSAT